MSWLVDGPYDRCYPARLLAVFGREELAHMRAAIALDQLFEGQVKSSFLGIYWAADHSLASA